ncbi:hypothetical protein RUND412_007043 [Rhizina undulata]
MFRNTLGLTYYRVYTPPPPHSELAMSELSDNGFPSFPVKPLPPSPPPVRKDKENWLGKQKGENKHLPPPPAPPKISNLPYNTRSHGVHFAQMANEVKNRNKRRIRFVCISDTHNTPDVKIPLGDVLIHAGDMTNDGSHSELKKAVEWLGKQQHEVKIIIAGNHDGVTLDPDFHKNFGSYFHTKSPQNHDENLALFTAPEAKAKGIVYLNHEMKLITLRDGRKFRVFGSPWSIECGLWGFGYNEPDLLENSVWASVPLDADILVTHGPPRFHLDNVVQAGKLEVGHKGCEMLRQALWSVRPQLHVFGHVHESRGVEIVRWDLSSKHVKYREENVRSIEDPDPESKKNFLVDLTFKGKEAFDSRDRSETCLVNASIMTTSWRKGRGHGSARNKPVVVDLELENTSEEQDGGLGGGDNSWQVRVRGVEGGWSSVGVTKVGN